MTTHATSSIQKPMKKLHNLIYHEDEARNVYWYILKFGYIRHENDLNTLFCLSLCKIRAPEKEGFHFCQGLSMLQTYRFIPRDITTARQWSTKAKYFPCFYVLMANSITSRNTSQIGKQESLRTYLYFPATQATVFTWKILFQIGFKLHLHFSHVIIMKVLFT